MFVILTFFFCPLYCLLSFFDLPLWYLQAFLIVTSSSPIIQWNTFTCLTWYMYLNKKIHRKKLKMIVDKQQKMSFKLCKNIVLAVLVKRQFYFMCLNFDSFYFSRVISLVWSFFSSPGPVVCCLSSVNFSHFKLFLRNHWTDWNQT